MLEKQDFYYQKNPNFIRALFKE